MLGATGFGVTVLGRTRNARTANPRSVVLRYRAIKPLARQAHTGSGPAAG